MGCTDKGKVELIPSVFLILASESRNTWFWIRALTITGWSTLGNLFGLSLRFLLYKMQLIIVPILYGYYED